MNYNFHILLISFLFSTLAQSQEVLVTASHLPPMNPTSFFNSGAGMAFDGMLFDNVEVQSFTAEHAGALLKIGFVSTRLNENTNADLRVDVVLWNRQNEIEEILATDYLPAESFTKGFISDLELNTFVDFSAKNIHIFEGVEYALVFSSDIPNANYRLYGDDLGYIGGSRFDSQNGSPFEAGFGDLFFQATVTVDAIQLGDINCDGAIDLLDVAPLVNSIASGEYETKADINQDGIVDLLDVAPFVELLTGV